MNRGRISRSDCECDAEIRVPGGVGDSSIVIVGWRPIWPFAAVVIEAQEWPEPAKG